MSSLARAFVVSGVAVFWGVTIWLSKWPSEDPLPISGPLAAAADCRACHVTVSAEWERSAHARAATNELFQARMSTSGNAKDCMPCHAPRPVLRTGLGNAVQAREHDQHLGVTCQSCHETAAAVAAVRTIPAAPCRPRADAQLAADAMCGACHRAIWRDLQGAHAAGTKVHCVGCHLPPIVGSDGATRADHSLSPGRLGQSIFLRARRATVIHVEVENSNVAHAFPGERHNRVLMLKVEYIRGDGAVDATEYHVIRGVAPFGSVRDSDEIAAGQTMSIELPNRPNAVRVSLLYKRVPWVLHDDAAVLQSVSLPPSDWLGDGHD